MKEPSDDTAPDTGGHAEGSATHFGVAVSTSPLVVLTRASAKHPAGAVVADAQEILVERPALHLLTCSWTLEQGLAGTLAEGISRAQSVLPLSRFLVLCANDLEVLACAEAGLDAILASAQIFVDERIWHPFAARTPRQYRAVYNARLKAFKRHELAAHIPSLLLTYAGPVDDSQDGSLARVRALLPRATFANHDLTGGAHRSLAPPEINQLLAQAETGLCLSAVEGSMRAAMEYLFAGLPIVTTPSVGGRDRYFVGGYVRTVSSDPDAVAHAATQLANLQLDRQRIRQHVGDMVAFDRHNFLLALNKHVRKVFGIRHDIFPSFAPFAGQISHQVDARQFRTQLRASGDNPGSPTMGNAK
jgi:hypothetical protein